jgi:hypothetical protein
MRKYQGIPELLEQFMEDSGSDARRVTVEELRNRFGLTRYQCNTVSGFLRRLEFGAFGRFPYIVVKIEHREQLHPSDPPQCRYLVRQNSRSASDTRCENRMPVACPPVISDPHSRSPLMRKSAAAGEEDDWQIP